MALLSSANSHRPTRSHISEDDGVVDDGQQDDCRRHVAAHDHRHSTAVQQQRSKHRQRRHVGRLVGQLGVTRPRTRKHVVVVRHYTCIAAKKVKIKTLAAVMWRRNETVQRKLDSVFSPSSSTSEVSFILSRHTSHEHVDRPTSNDQWRANRRLYGPRRQRIYGFRISCKKRTRRIIEM